MARMVMVPRRLNSRFPDVTKTHIGLTIRSSKFFRGQKHIFFDNYMLVFPAKEEMPSRSFPYTTFRAKRDQQRGPRDKGLIANWDAKGQNKRDGRMG
jgi:hypothetical protein